MAKLLLGKKIQEFRMRRTDVPQDRGMATLFESSFARHALPSWLKNEL